VPTIGSLLRVPPTAHPTCSTKLFEMMVVIQPKTLPYVDQELQNIAGHVPNKCLVKLGVPGAPATVNEVVSRLSAVSIAHFACHGVQNKEDPLESLSFSKMAGFRCPASCRSQLQMCSLLFSVHVRRPWVMKISPTRLCISVRHCCLLVFVELLQRCGKLSS